MYANTVLHTILLKFNMPLEYFFLQKIRLQNV
jgi:hypothetical protein